jgi:hypothetical protein
VYAFPVLIGITGKSIVAALLLGLTAGVLYPCWKRAEVARVWIVAASAFLGFWFFRSSITPAQDGRTVMVVLAPVFLLATLGVLRLLRTPLAIRLPRGLTRLAVGATLAGLTVSNIYSVPKVASRGVSEAAEAITGNTKYRDSVVLVVSSADVEGALVAQMAMRERRPVRYVLRASKALSAADWFGGSFRLKFSTPGELTAYLRRVPVGLLLLDVGGQYPRSLRQLLVDTVASEPDRWRLAGVFPGSRAGEPGAHMIHLYEQAGLQNATAPRIEVDMRKRLGRVLRND